MAARAKLKQIQKSLKEQDYDAVVAQTKELLKEENGQGQNVYNALVFAGVALSKLERNDEAEKVYLQAIKLFPDLPLAYQGVTKLYTDKEQWEKLGELFKTQVIRAVQEDDAEACAGALHKLIQLEQDHGSRKELTKLTNLLLPSSPIYNLLSRLPRLGDASATASGTEESTYTPFPTPEFPSPPTIHTLPLSSPPPPPGPSFQFTAPPPYPRPFPSVRQCVHQPETGLALLLVNTLGEEIEERQREEREVQLRRKRLGAGSEREVRRAVGRDVLSSSTLPDYYDEILRHPAASDEVRRAAESRMLRHYYRLMTCLSRNAAETTEKFNGKKEEDAKAFPEDLFAEAARQQTPPTKESVRAKVEELIKGMVLLKVEDEGAWLTTLEWTDVDALAGYDLTFLHTYLLLFPLSPVASLISGFLRYFGFPGPDAEEEDKARRAKRRAETRAREAAGKREGERGEKKREEEEEDEAEEAARRQSERDRDPFALLLAGFEACPKSAFAHRVMAEAHLREVDYANAISVAEKGVSLTRAIEVETGKKMPSARAALDVILGTALVHYYAPKHHPRALQLLDGVLKQNPKGTACLMGKGYIFLGESRFAEAREQFERALEIEPAKRVSEDQVRSDLDLEATECVGWSMVKEGRLEEGRKMLLDMVEVLDKDEARNQDSARVWTRIGQAEWQMGDSHREEAHEHWLTALKHFSNYAPAFTAIGIWYLEYASPPDEDRASKCFQKAFELDATEAEAARRLATGYANEGEWALVNLIAKRVMEGEGGLEGGLSGGDKVASNTKFLPTNAWAWKAVGAYDMINKKYAQAAQAFQVSLRADNEDPALWTRLGEAYAKSGKQVAALKALRRALELAPDSWICYYHIANIQHELGLDQQAIESLQKVMELSPGQPGVAVALALIQLSLGKQQSRDGFRARARINLIAAIRTLQPIVDAKIYRPTTWKTLGEICVHLWSNCRFEEDVEDAMDALLPILAWLHDNDENSTSNVKGVVSLSDLRGTVGSQPRDILKAGICAYAYRVDLLKYDTKIPEIAFYDLACALHQLANDYTETEGAERKAAISAATLNIKKALDIDPTSPTLWNAFGSVAALGSPQLAQHAYIVALELQPKNAAVWCNLGFLWFANNDYELAQQAFAKAKIVEPECALAWLGNGMIARMENKDLEAQACFAQAVMLSGGSMLTAALGNSKLLFEPLLANTLSNVDPNFNALHQASFALDRYCSAYPRDSSAVLLHGLILERLGQFDIAIERLATAVALIEAEYEAAESEEVEQRYAVALLNLGRIHLAQADQNAAVENLDNCFGLLSAREDNTAILMRVQAKTGLALAHAALEHVGESLEAFQEALSQADTLKLRESEKEALKERVSVSLAKTLWSIGGDEAFEEAKTRLLESFSAEQHSASAMVTLSSIALLTEDDALVEAVVAEGDELDECHLVEKDPQDLLRRFKALWKLHQGDLPAAKRMLSKQTHSAPANLRNRSGLAGLLLSYGTPSLAHAVLSGVGGDISTDLANNMRLKGLAAGAGEKAQGGNPEDDGVIASISDIQKSIMLQPWEATSWQSLAQVVI